MSSDSPTDQKPKAFVITLVAIGIVGIAGIVAAIIIVVNIFSQPIQPTTTDSSPSLSAPQQTAWDMNAAFNRVHEGMTKAQVEEATGKKSEDCVTDESSGGIVSEYCNYGDVDLDPGFIAITYSDGKVQKKSQHLY